MISNWKSYGSRCIYPSPSKNKDCTSDSLGICKTTKWYWRAIDDAGNISEKVKKDITNNARACNYPRNYAFTRDLYEMWNDKCQKGTRANGVGGCRYDSSLTTSCNE